MKKITNYLNETLKNERALLIFLFIVFIIGLVTGSIFINFITDNDKKLLVEQIEAFFLSINKLSNDVFGLDVFLDNLINNCIQIFVIFILGISCVGVIAVILILFFKGFILGTTLSTIILNYKIKGIVGVILYVFPMYIFTILIYIFICFFAVYVSIKFLKALLKKDNLNFKIFLGKYLLSLIVSIILIIITSILDAYLTPLLLKLFTFII